MLEFEHHKQPLLHKSAFRKRMFTFIGLTICLLFISLAIGTLGYHYIAEISWVDGFYNASMILTGMGPVADLSNHTAGKIFASFYALYSGVAFLSIFSIFISPFVHRFLHKINVNEEEIEEGKKY